MATIASAQSGSWTDGSTWVGGRVPDPGKDSVVIAATHTVSIGSGSYLMISGSIQVEWNGTLHIQGGLEFYDDLEVNGTLEVEGDYLFLMEGSSLTVGSFGQVTINSYLMGLTTTVQIHGHLSVTANAMIEANQSNWSISSSGGLTIAGSILLSGNSQVTLSGHLTIDSGGQLALHQTQLVIQYTGPMMAGSMTVNGTLDINAQTLVEVVGEFILGATGHFLVHAGCLIRVYKDVRLGGRMSGGGQIQMLRREGRILDADGNSLIVFDQAYGNAPVPIG